MNDLIVWLLRLLPTIPTGFVEPWRLLWLLLLPVLVVAYVLAQARRRSQAARLADTSLLASVLPTHSRWLGHLVAAGLVLSLFWLTVAYAQPTAKREKMVERATVVLAIDVSRSMLAQDVDPDRFTAAKRAAHDLLDAAPPRVNVGLVAFAGSARVILPPTQDRDAAHAAVDALRLSESTAIGEAIFASLDAMQRTAQDDAGVPRRIVVLSDGSTTVGRPDAAAAEAALQAGVPVDTVALGTRDGVVVLNGSQVPVPVDEAALAKIAQTTKGKAYQAKTAKGLSDIYRQLGTSMGFEYRAVEITDEMVGLGLLFLLASLGLNVWARGRMV